MIARKVMGHIRLINGVRVDEPVSVTFQYDRSMPLMLSLLFEQEGVSETRTWEVSRGLMLEGVESPVPVGVGDFRVTCAPHRTQVGFCLRSPDGHADVTVSRSALMSFLKMTEAECIVDSPEEEEALARAVDSFLEEVLGE